MLQGKSILRGRCVKKFLILLVVFVVVGIIPALRYIDDGTMLSEALAKGFGRTLAIGLLSCLGLLYRTRKNLGFGIAAVIFTVLLIVAMVSVPQHAESNEDAVVGEIRLGSSSCTPDYPLLVRLTNVSDQEVLSVGFRVIVSDAGHSTEYFSVFGSGMGTDRIIPPGHSIDDCYGMPPFYVGNDNPAPAPDIPAMLASPEYRIEVTGAKLR